MHRRYNDYHMPIPKQSDSDRHILLFVASIERNQQNAKMSLESSNKSADEMREIENVIYQSDKMAKNSNSLHIISG